MKNMIVATDNCLKNKGLSGGSLEESDWSEAMKCETAYFSEGNGYTYHTHPNGSEQPSELDKKTTKQFGKKFMFIGLVPQRKVVVYSDKDNFNEKIAEFGV